ncbi:MAG: hypothetical protein LQ338_003638 [Usnochroma carphineum]|nr:MAG: hypothetical protein LQ338_003638 [Usnochroma carphineum]
MVDNSAPAPVIPPRTSVRTPKQPRRRRSSPSASSISTVKRSLNHVTVKPASPEVLSSLISSLSTISDLTVSHFETSSDIDHPQSTPASPHPYRADFLSPSVPHGHASQPYPTSPAKIGFGMDDGASRRLYLPPQGASSVHASLRSTSSYNDLRPRSPRRIKDSEDETSSIGQVSIEPAPWLSTTSLASAASCQSRSDKTSCGIRRSSDGAKKNSKGDDYQDGKELVDTLHDMVPKSPRAASEHSAATAGQHPNDLSGSPVVGNGHVVPSRDSSLRHSFGGSSRHRKRRSQRSNEFTADGRSPSIDEHSIPPQSEPAQEAARDLVENEITRRIQELKDQKRLREISLTVTTPDLMPPSPQVSRSPSPLRILQTPHSPLSPLSIEPAPLDKMINQSSKAIDQSKNENNDENSAPSPSVVQRVDRKSKRNSISGKPFTIKPFPGSRPSEPSRTQSTPVQRSNSKLLRRLSRPTSPTTTEKHRRTFTHLETTPLGPVERPKSTDSIGDAVHEYLLAPRLSQTTTDSKSGRVISFSEVGDPEGSVIFCCVGMGLTRYTTAFYDDLAKTLKLRLITPDRPGVGGSEVHSDGTDTPLGWPDDVLAICQRLKLTKFSLLAHSAGAIYALATALRMPQHIRGRIHLLAPWIPPSQMSGIGTHQESLPATSLPLTQRFLQSLPTTFLKAANSNYLRTTSASITTSLPKSPRRSKRKSMNAETPVPRALSQTPKGDGPLKIAKTRGATVRQDSLPKEAILSDDSDFSPSVAEPPGISEKERKSTYDSRLTAAIWDASTTGANPAVDLLVCLERKQPIGFRYVDITKSVIIHHGSKDTRVPVENVKWLGKTMRRCEVRVLEGEGHGLMASAVVMGNVLMEMAKEWQDWIQVVQGKGRTDRRAFSP